MTFNLKEFKNDLLFLPLGGSGEIGMNLNMYYYNGKWLIVDIGIGFADPSFPGVDIIVPNINFLVSQRKNIAGIVLTHAHEDHIGGVPYLWEEINAPIYTNNFTGTVLKAKLKENGLLGKVPLTILESNKVTKIGPFEIEMVNITHSILENNGIMIRTSLGNIFHTGDWKIDDDPRLGHLTDKKKLKQLGKEGVLAMIGDSTNIFNPGRSGSEGDLEESLKEIIQKFKTGMVVVTTFASNVARLQSIARAAKKAKRKVVLVGRSMWRMYRAAKDCGYLDDIDDFLEDRAAVGMPRESLLLITTGCQGEPLAAVNKLASNSHPHLKVVAGDTIIFSSKIIPGNDKKIYSLFNRFCKMGVEVLTERDHFVHVSGHPAVDEVADMYSFIKPKIAVPVHGEAIHIHAHAKFAKELGCAHAIEIENGDVLCITGDKPRKVAKVESGYMLIDGDSIIEEDSHIIKTRRKIRDNGAILISANVAKKNKKSHIHSVSLSAPGLFDKSSDAEMIRVIQEELLNLNLATGSTESDIERDVMMFVKKFVKKELSKFPEIVVHISYIAEG